MWPPSHSYLVTQATGWLLLRNCTDDKPLQLTAQRRETAQIAGSLVLQPQTTVALSYRGHWCIRVRYAEANEPRARRSAAPGDAIRRAGVDDGNDDRTAESLLRELEQAIQLVTFETHNADPSVHLNTLGMA